MAAKKYSNLLIIGSGPVGMVAALLLKDQFEQIIILERQSKERFLKTHGFTFPIVFSPAAIRILEQIGAWEAIKAEWSPFFGVVIHKRLLGKDFTYTSTQDGIYSHWRNHIVASLYERVVQENIPVHFESSVQSIDFENNRCVEATLGTLPFDLLLGTDGINSQTRRLMANVHPNYPEEAFQLQQLENWYAYRLPATGKLKEAFGGGEKHHASHVFVDNIAAFPNDKVRIVTTSMKQPDEEISILIKYEPTLNMERLKQINDRFVAPYVDSMAIVDREWGAGYGGKFGQVHAPTSCLNHVQLLGDSAHGFESTGDLINVGVTSVGSFVNILNNTPTIPEALKQFDQTIGEDLRFYAQFALRRSYEKINAEVAGFEIGYQLGIVDRHPGLFGIFEDDFEIRAYMKKYQRDMQRVKLFFLGLPVAFLFLIKSLRSKQENMSHT